MKLPKEFENRMKELLGKEYSAFLESYEHRPYQALRVNTCKLAPEEFQRISPFELRPVPWAPGGFYYGEADRPGKHPWHEAGLYYIQEPSAMAVGALAGAAPGERILDLCAAPGGKTTQLAAAMKGQGLLVSNEIHPARVKILSSNVERMGITNAVVTNETPERLAEHFPGFFDRIVVDAPCSGEGMFRKDEQAVTQWSPENVKMCAERQQSILEQAAEMLRPGGVLVYSTCTFAPEEDEGSMAAFLLRHPEFAVKKVEACESFAPGHPEWAAEVLADVQKEEDRGKGQGRTVEEAAMQVRDTFRLWPHLLEGEGHYLAVLEKSGSRAERNEKERAGKKAERGRTAGNRFGKDRMGQREKEAIQLYQEFARETLAGQPEGIPVLFGDQLFLLPCELNLAGLKVLRAGLHLGMVKKNRFEPSHALALALRAEDALRVFSYPADSGEIRAYLRGEELQPSGKQGEIQKGQKEERAGKAQKGWALVLVDGYPLGWGKLAGGMLKNHYPKGLRLSW